MFFISLLNIQQIGYYFIVQRDEYSTMVELTSENWLTRENPNISKITRSLKRREVLES